MCFWRFPLDEAEAQGHEYDGATATEERNEITVAERETEEGGGGADGACAQRTGNNSPEISGALEGAYERISGLKELETTTQRCMDLEEEVRLLKEKVNEERNKNRVLWSMHCEKLVEYDELIVQREEGEKAGETSSSLRASWCAACGVRAWSRGGWPSAPDTYAETDQP